jgi:hypothetical protein
MKNRSDKPNDDKREELRQQLWELAYGLLEPNEASTLIARVKSDPAVARLYAEVKLQIDLVSKASRVEDSSLTLTVAGKVGPAGAKDKRPAAGKARGSKTGQAGPVAKKTGSGWGTNWLAVAGTTALLVLLSYGLWQAEQVTRAVAQGEYYYTRITGLATMTEGVTQRVSVEYKNIHDQGRAAELEVRLVDQQGQETYRTQVKTAEDGKAEVELPGAVLKKGVRLEVAPAAVRHDDRRDNQVVSTELQIADEKRKTVLLTERPYAEPGESNRFQLFGVGQYSKTITPPAADEQVIEQQLAGEFGPSELSVESQNGVISGVYRLPKRDVDSDDLATRRRAMAATNEQAKQADGAAESLALKEMSPSNAKAPEGLELQRGTLNGAAQRGIAQSAEARPKLDERDAAGRGGAVLEGRQAEMAAPRLLRGAEPPRAAAAPAAPPVASPVPAPLAPAPLPAETMERGNSVDSPADRKGAPSSEAFSPHVLDKAAQDSLPKPGASQAPGERQFKSASQQDTRVSPQEQFAAPAMDAAGGARVEMMRDEFERLAAAGKAQEVLRGGAIAVPVPQQVRGEDLVMIARDAGGRVVALRELAGYREPEAKVELPPEVDGLINVQLFRKDEPQTSLLSQQVVRASERTLNFEVTGLKEAYAPGETVQLLVRVVDELGRPANVAAGVRVWSDVAARAAGSPLLLVDRLSQVDSDGSVAADAVSSDAAMALSLKSAAPPQDRSESPERKPAQEAATVEMAADTAIADAGPPALPAAAPATNEVFFVDNQRLVQQEYERAQAILAMERAERMQSFGRLLIWAGAGLMLLVGVLLIVRMPLKPVVWIPAAGLAALSLALGVAWFLSQPKASWQLAQTLPEETIEGPADLTNGGNVNVTLGAESPPAADERGLAVAPRALEDEPATPQAQLLRSTPSRSGDEGAEGSARVRPPGTPAKPAADAGLDRQSMALNRAKAETNEAKKDTLPAEKTAPLAADSGEKKASRSPAAKLDEAEGEDRGQARSQEESVPDSLFWRPLSPVEADGTFTIEFTMPAAEADYRLLIDAIGSGRIGGKEELLRCRK